MEFRERLRKLSKGPRLRIIDEYRTSQNSPAAIEYGSLYNGQPHQALIMDKPGIEVMPWQMTRNYSQVSEA